jgi:predicted component of type VI protein secretion system
LEDTGQAKLRIIRGVGKGREFSIETTPLFIGRGDDVAVRKNQEGLRLDLPDQTRSISRKHAKIVSQGGQYQIIDTSVNGTLVNGKKISFEDLKHNSTIEIGKAGGEVMMEFIITQNIQDFSPPKPSFETEPKFTAPSQENPFLEYTKVIHRFHQGNNIDSQKDESSSNMKWFAIISITLIVLFFIILLMF